MPRSLTVGWEFGLLARMADLGPTDRRRAYWRANLRLITLLLTIWAAVSYGAGILLVEWFNQFHIGALPLGYWFANQGSMFVFVILIFVYAWRMERLDRKFGVEE